MQTMKRSYSEFDQEMENARHRIEAMDFHPHKKRICLPDHDISQLYNNTTSTIKEINSNDFIPIIEPLDVEMIIDDEADLLAEPETSTPKIPFLRNLNDVQEESLLQKFKLNPEASQLILYQPKQPICEQEPVRSDEEMEPVYIS